MRLQTMIAIGAVLISGIGFSAVSAQAQDAATFEVGDLSCRDMLKMDSTEQQLVMVYMHGFVSGKSGTTLIDGPALRAATDEIKDGCIDAPDDALLSVFDAVRG